MKKIISMILALTLAAALLAGCSGNGGSSSSDGNNGQSSSSQPVKEVSVDEVLTAIKEAYGDDFLADTEIPAEMMEIEFPVPSDIVKEMKGMMPTIGFHPDRIVVVQAVEGKGADVEAELKKIRENMIQNSMTYPANIAKVNASQVLRNGDTVCFLLAGAVNEDMDASEEDAQKFAEAEVQKGVDAFQALFA